MNLFTLCRFKAHDGPGMKGCRLHGVFQERAVTPAMGNLECLVAINNKIVTKVLRYTAAVPCSVTNDLFLLRNNLHIRSLIKCVYYKERAIGRRESKTKLCSPFSGTYLGGYIMICQVN